MLASFWLEIFSVIKICMSLPTSIVNDADITTVFFITRLMLKCFLEELAYLLG